MFRMYRMISAMMLDANNYQDRKVARSKTKGLIISTAYSSDCGYETAICDASGAHPIERYATKAEAKRGHKKWVKKSTKLDTILALGDADGLVQDYIVKIKRFH